MYITHCRYKCFTVLDCSFSLQPLVLLLSVRSPLPQVIMLHFRALVRKLTVVLSHCTSILASIVYSKILCV